MKSLRRQTPRGDTVFCDDIRQEIGGKVSYIGIYRGAINFPNKLPATLSKLCFAISYVERIGESSDPVELRLFMPGDKEEKPTLVSQLPVEQMRKLPAPENFDSEDPAFAMIAHLQLTNVNLAEEGRIQVRAHRGDQEIRLGSIKVTSAHKEGEDEGN